LPVLTTDTCGYAPHILKADAGAVIESPFSQETLNQTLSTFIKDSDQRQQMSKNALAYCAAEDLYSCHQAAAEIIEHILLSKLRRYIFFPTSALPPQVSHISPQVS